ncbi:ABC transporter ATP-binding protein [Clostridia bacterium]|nr:ABC transporter ATP-binding protein [Clostridia bacterium]
MKRNFANLLFLITDTFRTAKGALAVTVINSVFAAVLPLVNIVGVGIVISALTTGERESEVFRRIIIFVAVNLAVGILRQIISLFDFIAMRKSSDVMQLAWVYDAVNLNYHYVQDRSFLNNRAKTMNAKPPFYINKFGTFIEQIVQIAGSIYIFSRFSPLFIIALAATLAVSILLTFKNRKLDFEFYNVQIEDDRKLNYLYNIMTNYDYAKEVRINRADSFVANKYRTTLSVQLKKFKTYFLEKLRINTLSTIITIVQTAAMYLYFTWLVHSGTIGIAEYTVLLGTTTLLTSILLGFFDNIAQIGSSCESVQFAREYNEFIEKNSNISRDIPDADVDFNGDIVFENVTFTYPGSENPTLSDISVTLKHGEKFGMVGLNGSGKTTFVKLLTRLYDPDSGRITIGGVDIKSIPHRKYIERIGIVLQDFTLFAYSVKENVVFDKTFDEKRFTDSLEKSGIAAKIAGLPKGADTSVYRQIDDDGIEFSGGEGQKLAMARAIYKNANVLVLDEPTANLDPIAEYDLFSRLSEIADGRTAFFISHRLSSTKFCDKIIVLDGGKIAELGSHDELMSKPSLYAELFLSQAKFYGRTESK